MTIRPHKKIYKYCARIIPMTYTEIKMANGRKYFYRVRSIRKGKKFIKKRIYIGKDLSEERGSPASGWVKLGRKGTIPSFEGGS